MTRLNPDFVDMDWDGYAGHLPLRHLGRPPDIGEAATWLVSDASAFVTGIDLPVDGGLTATSYTVEPKHANNPRSTDFAPAGATTHHQE
jgi:enoyl-[acyl-carrier-protein] reductase (NADH)